MFWYLWKSIDWYYIFIACFNVCVGLLCCCSAYFHELVPKISYFKWLLVFAVFSFVISCAGLNAILNVSLPILKVMCPIAIALTFMVLSDVKGSNKYLSHRNMSALLTRITRQVSRMFDLNLVEKF